VVDGSVEATFLSRYDARIAAGIPLVATGMSLLRVVLMAKLKSHGARISLVPAGPPSAPAELVS